MITAYIRDSREGPEITALYVAGVHISLVVGYHLNAFEFYRLSTSEEVKLHIQEQG